MARALSSRRGRKAADEWAEPPGEQRQEISNAKARADTIRMAVREQARMEAEIKALNADLREFKTTHVKGDLGFKLADWNAIYRVSQLEVEDRDVLVDALREGFAALGIGGTLDWVAAERGEAQPNGAASRGRAAKAADPQTENPDAFEQGEADGFAGHRDHAARYAGGAIGSAAYELGHQAGERKRYAAEPGHAGNGAEGEGELVREMRPGAGAAPKRARGRPRKAKQPALILVDGEAAQ